MEEFENMIGEKTQKVLSQTVTGQAMRWSNFKNNDSRDIFPTMSQRLFPLIKNMKNGVLSDFN